MDRPPSVGIHLDRVCDLQRFYLPTSWWGNVLGWVLFLDRAFATSKHHVSGKRLCRKEGPTQRKRIIGPDRWPNTRGEWFISGHWPFQTRFWARFSTNSFIRDLRCAQPEKLCCGTPQCLISPPFDDSRCPPMSAGMAE